MTEPNIMELLNRMSAHGEPIPFDLGDLASAITKRGWGYGLSNVFEPQSGDAPAITEGIDAAVYVSIDGNYAEIIHYEHATDPYAALLGAYVVALDEQKNPTPKPEPAKAISVWETDW